MSTVVETHRDPLATFGALGREWIRGNPGENRATGFTGAAHTFDEGESPAMFHARAPRTPNPQLPIAWKLGNEVKMSAKDISESVVNGMTAGAQWAYNCNKSTRGAVKRAKTVKPARIRRMTVSENPLKDAADAYVVSVAASDRARAELYAQIRQSRAAGTSLRQIAAETGLSFQRVDQITKGEK